MKTSIQGQTRRAEPAISVFRLDGAATRIRLTRGWIFLLAAACCAASSSAPAAPYDASRLLNETTQDYYVTSDGAPAGGTHVTAPGDGAGGINHDGVGQLLLDLPNNFIGLCTASLLADGGGRFAITAAHCVADGGGAVDVSGATLNWNVSGVGSVSATSTPAQIYVHPSFNGVTSDGFDIAILEFASAVDPAVPRYQLNRTLGNELNVTTTKFGFGRSGHGNTGDTIPSSFVPPGVKRWGVNEWEDDGLATLGIGGPATGLSGSNSDTQLTYDFDNGLVANDAFDFFGLGPADLGLGTDEVGAAPGDSGGPSFIDVLGIPRIAGVTSFGRRVNFVGGGSSDIDSVLNASFGEFSVDARVAHPQVLSFIDAIVPEPSSMALLFVGGLGLVLAARRRRLGPLPVSPMFPDSN